MPKSPTKPATPLATHDPAILAVFDAMIAAVPGVERKGASLPYVSLNGNMVASISKAGVIGLRLAPADLAEFLAVHRTTLFESLPGFYQKDYAAVPPALLADLPVLQGWFRRSHAHVAGLRAKRPPADPEHSSRRTTVTDLSSALPRTALELALARPPSQQGEFFLWVAPPFSPALPAS